MIDALLIVFSCVAANHLGLVKAIETVTNCHLLIVNCPRCLSFWCLLVSGMIEGGSATDIIAIAFVGAWLAPWMELAMGYTDTLFDACYDKIYDNKDDTPAAGDSESDTDRVLSDMRKGDCQHKTQ